MHLIIKTTSLATLFVTIFIAANSHAQSLTNGLVAYYQLNGNGNDSSDNNNNLTLGGSPAPAFVSGILGIPNSAMSFNGSNYCYTSSPLIVTNPFTWSCWVKITSLTLPATQTALTVLEQSGSSHTASPILWCNINTNTSPATVSYELYTYNGSSQTVTSPSMTLNTNQWVQIVGTSDTNGVKSIYVNGVLEGTSSAQPFGQVLSRFDMGGLYAYSILEQYQLAVVRIFNRALSASEVAQLYSIDSGQTLSLIKAVTLQDYSLNVGTNYQLQVSSDLINWTNQGAVFTATSSYWLSTNYWNVANWNQLFFRVVQQ